MAELIDLGQLMEEIRGSLAELPDDAAIEAVIEGGGMHDAGGQCAVVSDVGWDCDPPHSTAGIDRADSDAG